MTTEKWLTETQELVAEATPGPWERGDWWHIQGAKFCPCRPEWGPAIKRRMDINGTMMNAHIHRRDKPIWEHGVYTAELGKDGSPSLVVNETSEYGLMEDPDAALIAAAPTLLTQATNAIAAVIKAHEPVDALMNPGRHERVVKVCTGCGTDDGNWQRWPCPTMRALDAALTEKDTKNDEYH